METQFEKVPSNVQEVQGRGETFQAARDKLNQTLSGVSEQAKIELQLRDNTQISGWVSQLSMNDFVINDSSTGAARTISYKEVAKAKGKNPAAKGKKKGFGWMDALALIP